LLTSTFFIPGRLHELIKLWIDLLVAFFENFNKFLRKSAFRPSQEGVRLSFFVNSSSATNSVDVVLHILGKVIIDNVENIVDIKSSGSNISGDHDIAAAILKPCKNGRPGLERLLRSKRVRAMGIHGDKTQQARSAVISRFKDGSCNVMVATDVAARGLDINDVLHVVNYDFPQDMENYIHRIGRTGRVNKKGKSYTLLARSEGRFAQKLIKILKESDQEVNPELYELMKSARYEKSAGKQRYSTKETRLKQNKSNRYGNQPRYQNRSLGYDDDEEGGGGYSRRQPRYQNRNSDYGDDDGGYGGYNRNSRYNDRSHGSRGPPRRSSDFDAWESRHKGPTLD
jgi:superfamily II DNA/RNA helicase